MINSLEVEYKENMGNTSMSIDDGMDSMISIDTNKNFEVNVFEKRANEIKVNEIKMKCDKKRKVHIRRIMVLKLSK